MGKVEAFSVSGLDLWFYSSDHVPAHIHARRPGEWEIRVYLLECSDDHFAYDIVWGGEPPKRFRLAILCGVLLHRVALVEEWERKVCPSS